MDIEQIRALCMALPQATEDVKWGHDLCFSLHGKMFCVVALIADPTVSFKVHPEAFEEFIAQPGIIPAPYMARAHWIQVTDLSIYTHKEYERFIRNSYQLIKAKLPKKLQ